MGENGFPVDSGPIAVMLAEHDIGREFVKVLKDVLANINSDKTVAVSRVVESLHGFAEHLRQHISKEDTILYPMAIRLTEPAHGEDIVRRYREQISEADSEELNKKYEQLISDLKKLYVR